jgi:hypothetical protein
MAFDKLKSLFIDWSDEECYYPDIEDKYSIGSIDDIRKRIYDWQENDDFKEFDSFQEIELFIDDSNINSYIKQKDYYNDFQTMLFKMIDERHLKDSDVYNKVHIDRRLFSKIRNDKTYHPSKETIILLGLSLELNEPEIEKLLESASYSLPKNNHFDLIIRFCFINKIYKLIEVNELLNEYNCKLFNY